MAKRNEINPSRTFFHNKSKLICIAHTYLVPMDLGGSHLPILEQNVLFTELQALGSVGWPLQIKDNWRCQAPEHIFIISLIMGAWQLLD